MKLKIRVSILPIIIGTVAFLLFLLSLILKVDKAMYTIQCIEGHDIMKIYKIEDDIYEVKSLIDGTANLKSKEDVYEITKHAYFCEKKKPTKRLKST